MVPRENATGEPLEGDFTLVTLNGKHNQMIGTLTAGDQGGVRAVSIACGRLSDLSTGSQIVFILGESGLDYTSPDEA